MIEDRIHYAIAKHGDTGQFPGRIELGFKNLTRAEAAQLLLTLDKLQTDRKTALYLCDAVELDQASKPETVARDFTKAEGIPFEGMQATAADDFTKAHGLDMGVHRNA